MKPSILLLFIIVTFITACTDSEFTDSRDGKKYKTVKIGTQTWMAENLNYNASGSRCYGEGGQVAVGEVRTTLSDTEVQNNCTEYGRLYDWKTAMAGSASSTANPSGIKGICPNGWHLPSMAEWNTLESYINSDKNCTNCDAKHLKATSAWSDSNVEDTYGFAALPSGFGISDGTFIFIKLGGLWWSASEYDNFAAYYRAMSYADEVAHWGYEYKSDLYSVRCVKD